MTNIDWVEALARVTDADSVYMRLVRVDGATLVDCLAGPDDSTISTSALTQAPDTEVALHLHAAARDCANRIEIELKLVEADSDLMSAGHRRLFES